MLWNVQEKETSSAPRSVQYWSTEGDKVRNETEEMEMSLPAGPVIMSEYYVPWSLLCRSPDLQVARETIWANGLPDLSVLALRKSSPR